MPHELTYIEIPEGHQIRTNWLVPARYTVTRSVLADDQQANIADVLDEVRWILGWPGATMRLRDANGLLSSEVYLTSGCWRAVGSFLGLHALPRGDIEQHKDELTGDVFCTHTCDALNFRDELIASVTAACSTSEKLGSSNISRWSELFQLVEIVQQRADVQAMHAAIGFLIEQIDGHSASVIDIAAENYEATLIDADGTVVTPW